VKVATTEMKETNKRKSLNDFYDSHYYKDITGPGSTTLHLRRLAREQIFNNGERVLDIACGTGEWLRAGLEQGARISGIDISYKALRSAEQHLPKGCFVQGSAEYLPYAANSFDLVTCFGALEHFADKNAALKEMKRVLTENGRVVILVPNAGFLTRRLGLFGGTDQTAIREDVLSLDAWQLLFEESGFHVIRRWKDLHVLSIQWLMRKGWLHLLPRLTQALALPFWPLSWQYQVYHLLTPVKEPQ
jgi:SAM-dependent methyltransferase